jgi:zinc/manganese transport system permease protein
LTVTWLGLALAYFYDQPVGFYITTLAFGSYLLAHSRRWLVERANRRRQVTT